MRVTHVYKDYYPPVFGGIEQHVNVLCRGLTRAGLRVRVLCANTAARTVDEELDGVRVTRVACFGRLVSTPLSPLFPAWIRRLAPATDLFHFHFPNPPGELGFLLSGVRTPFVVTYHCDIVRQAVLLPVYGPLIRRFLGRAARIVVSTPRHVSMSDFLMPLADRCTVVPFGIDLARLAAVPDLEARAEAWRRKLGAPLVLFVGRFRHYKGIHVLLQAMSRVPGWLALVGTGSLEPELRRQAEAGGLAARVAFLGNLAEDDLWALYRAADVLALPSTSRAEAFGIVQLEAMACGRPVVCTEVGTGTTFVNRDGETGIVVPPGDASALAAALGRLIEDPATARALGARGQQRVREEFSLTRMTERTLAVYGELLGPAVAGTPAGRG